MTERTEHACSVFLTWFVDREGVAGFEPNMHVRFGCCFQKTETLLYLMVTHEVKKRPCPATGLQVEVIEGVGIKNIFFICD